MQFRHLLLPTAVALLLSACAMSAGTCTVSQTQEYSAAVSPIVDQYDTLMDQAEAADYETRGTYLAALQELRVKAESLEVPACAQSDLDWYLGRMDTGIEGLAALQAMTPTPNPTGVPPTPTPIPEQPIKIIELAGGVANPEAEISGMPWHGDTLVLLPQRPAQEGDQLYTLNKSDILAYLDGTSTDPLAPGTIRFNAPGVPDNVDGFDGFEAIAFNLDEVYVLIEAQQDQGMLSYLAKGSIAEDESQINIDTETMAEIAAQSIIPEAAEETLLIAKDRLLTFYEVNEERSTPNPLVHAFDTDLRSEGTIPLPNVEWRITDATDLDGEDQFWVVDTSFLALASESLIEFQYADTGVTRVPGQTIPLILEAEPRNWEGVVRLDDRGFLIVTDRDPETILAFVALP